MQERMGEFGILKNKPLNEMRFLVGSNWRRIFGTKFVKINLIHPRSIRVFAIYLIFQGYEHVFEKLSPKWWGCIYHISRSNRPRLPSCQVFSGLFCSIESDLFYRTALIFVDKCFLFRSTLSFFQLFFRRGSHPFFVLLESVPFPSTLPL